MNHKLPVSCKESQDFIDVSPHNLYWRKEKKIQFNSNNEDFFDYLVKEKNFLAQKKANMDGMICLFLAMTGLFFIIFGIINLGSRILLIWEGTYEIPENSVFTLFEFPTEFNIILVTYFYMTFIIFEGVSLF